MFSFNMHSRARLMRSTQLSGNASAFSLGHLQSLSFEGSTLRAAPASPQLSLDLLTAAYHHQTKDVAITNVNLRGSFLPIASLTYSMPNRLIVTCTHFQSSCAPDLFSVSAAFNTKRRLCSFQEFYSVKSRVVMRSPPSKVVSRKISEMRQHANLPLCSHARATQHGVHRYLSLIFRSFQNLLPAAQNNAKHSRLSHQHQPNLQT